MLNAQYTHLLSWLVHAWDDDSRINALRREPLVADIVQSCGLERATGAVDAALQCVIQAAASPALQARCLVAFSLDAHRMQGSQRPA